MSGFRLLSVAVRNACPTFVRLALKPRLHASVLSVVAVLAFGLVAAAPGTRAQDAANAWPGTFVVVQDGPSPLLDATAQAIVDEAKAMFGTISMERLRGDFTAAGTTAILKELFRRGDVQGVMVVGPLLTQAAAEHAGAMPPTVSVLGAPLAVHGVNDARPLVDAGTGLSFAGDLALLRQLAPRVRRLHVPVTPTARRALPQLDVYLRAASDAHGIEIRALEVEGDFGLPASLAEHEDAVYLGVALSPEDLSMDALIASASQRRIAVVAGLSPDAVTEGALMSVVPDHAASLRARQAVLAMQGLLEGEPPGSLRAEVASARVVTSESALAFKLNLDVARALGIEPTFALLQSAEIVEIGSVERTSFARAVERALGANRTLEAAQWHLSGGAARVRRARGRLMPAVVANASGTWIDGDRAAGPFPPSERMVSVGGTASQPLYAPGRIGDAAVEKRQQRARTHDFAATRLDVMLDVAVRYVELMRARVIVDIAEQRVRSSRANLALAEGRNRAGDVGRDEVFRWRVDLAESQQALVRAKASLAEAMANLNEIQSYDPQRRVHPEEPDGSALPMLATDHRLSVYFERPSGLSALEDLSIERALAAAPELAAARARIDAADRREKQQLRTLLLPDVDLVASLTGRVWNHGRGSNVAPIPGLIVPDNLDWSVGVVATLPLFEGLSQKSAVDEANAETRRLRAEEQALALQLARRVYNALQEASAAYQATTLATAAAQASQENLEIVRDAYARGSVDVIRLVDAQTQAYANEAAAKNAYHDFLIAFVAVERLLGQFSFGPGAMNIDDFFRALARLQPAIQASVEP